jgi:hypothetical protein
MDYGEGEGPKQEDPIIVHILNLLGLLIVFAIVFLKFGWH